MERNCIAEHLGNMSIETGTRGNIRHWNSLPQFVFNLFESFVNKLGIIKVFDNGIYREIIFDKEFSSKLNYEEIFVKSLEINKKFKFSFRNGMLSVSLYYKDVHNHVVFSFVDFFEELL